MNNSATSEKEGISRRLTIAGAGRVARSLARAADSAGFTVDFAVRNAASDTLEGHPCHDLQEWNGETGWVVIAVSDDAIEEVSARLAPKLLPETIVCHTSGGSGMERIARHTRHGIFYPLRSFSGRETPEVWRRTPILTEASDSDTLREIMIFAQRISDTVRVADSEQRALLHVAAVFANNFTTCLLDCSNRLMKRAGLPFELLGPLVTEGIENIMTGGKAPSEWQTGPAVRGDKKTIERHRAILEKEEGLKQIYDLLTRQIENDHGKL